MRMKVSFSENNMEVVFRQSEENRTFGTNLGEIQIVTKYVGGEPYEGDYSVTLKVDAQTMATKGKVMMDDVLIRSIPFFNVSNTSGGNTVYIGNEV